MFSKLSEWFEFHIAVLERKKQPFFIWLSGILMAYLGIIIYETILTRLYNSIFHNLIVDNIDILKQGLWVVPLIVFLFFWQIGLDQHKKNIQKIVNLV